ncbi:MAG TPA: hypothetical protein VFV08_14065, partial [Puia sp.]|nr:hypothetical protein [Puia sp.]
RTGNSFVDSFSEILVFFPLLPVFVILFRKIYRQDIFNYLTIICVLDFAKRLILRVALLNTANQNSFVHIFSLMEFILLVLAFRTILKKESREILNVIAIALISAVITQDVINGIAQKKALLDGIQHAFIVMLAAYCLVRSVVKENLQILYSGQFWISTGTLFFFCTAMLVDAMDGCCTPWKHSFPADSELLFDFASLARYFFYVLAALLYRSKVNSVE